MCAFPAVADVMSSLKITKIFYSSFRRIIAEFAPPGDRPDLVDDERQRMLGIRGLVIMNRAESSATDATGALHRFEPGPVFSAQVSVAPTYVSSHYIESPRREQISVSLCLTWGMKGSKGGRGKMDENPGCV